MDEREREWQARADATAEDQPLDWRESRRIEQETERLLRKRGRPTAEQWAVLNENPWAELQ